MATRVFVSSVCVHISLSFAFLFSLFYFLFLFLFSFFIFLHLPVSLISFDCLWHGIRSSDFVMKTKNVVSIYGPLGYGPASHASVAPLCFKIVVNAVYILN